LMEKMKWVERYPMPVMGTARAFGTKSVTVRLKDGKEYHREVAIAKGMPQNQLTASEFNSKYEDCASTVLSKEGIEKSLSMLSKLREVKNISELIKLFQR